MTQEEKQLLLVDLCARLPYGVKVRLDTGDKTFDTDLVGLPSNNIVNIHDKENYETIEECFIWNIKPYLRPMNSMTKKEQKEFAALYVESMNLEGINSSCFCAQFYYKHHIDGLGLIEKGLALEAPEGMYKSK